jgi:hypothetical protein
VSAKGKDGGNLPVRKVSFDRRERVPGSGDTLNAEDLAPAWRGPAASKARHAS